MKKIIATTLITAAIAAAVLSTLFAQTTAKTESAADSRLDKIIQQNDQLLREQAELKRLLEEVAKDVQIIKRRTS